MNLLNRTTYQGSQYNHKLQKQIQGTSNAKIFDGEDLTYGDRKRLQQLQSDHWLKQQIQEKQYDKQRKNQEKDIFDQQTIQVNQYRKQLEEEKKRRAREMELAAQSQNAYLIEQKINRMNEQKKIDEESGLNHMDYVNNHDFFTENPDSTQSMMNRNRVLKYHWKGMTDAQKKEILDEQEKQRKDKELQKQLEKQEQKLYAQQMEAQRKAIILENKNKNAGTNNLRKGMDQYNRLKAEEMKKKGYQMYDGVHTTKNE